MPQAYAFQQTSGRLWSAISSGTSASAGADGSCAAGSGTEESEELTGSRYDLTYGYVDDRLTTVSQQGGPTATYTYGGVGSTGPHQVTGIALLGLPTVSPDPDNPIGAVTATGLPPNAGLGYDEQGRVTSVLPVAVGVPALTDVPALSVASRTSTYAYDHSGNPTSITAVSLDATNPGGPGGPIANAFSVATEAAYRADGTRIAQRSINGTNVEEATVYHSDGTELGCTTLTTCATTDGLTGLRSTRHFTTPTGTPVATRTSDGWSWLLPVRQAGVRHLY